MRWYHVGMALLDLTVLINIHFWTGYSIGVLLDRSLFLSPKGRERDELRLLGELIGQVTLMGYVYVLLAPLLSELTNPAWRLVKEKTPPASGGTMSRSEPYDPRLASNMMENAFVLAGIMCGSPNFVDKLKLLSHPSKS